jgi:hypothetical protein
MATPFYRAGFEKQLTGSALGGQNCAAAAGAMLCDQATLGLKNPTPDAFRRATGDSSGGLNVGQIGSTMAAKYGIHTTVYDGSDGYSFDEMVAHLKQGRFMVASGDYDQVPASLKGDKGFGGFHSVFFHAWSSTGITVGDGLCDGRRPGIPKGYVKWPISVARNFVDKLDHQVPGNSLYACVMDLKRLKARPVTPATNIRAAASNAAAIIDKFGGAQTVVWGGTVTGQSIGGNSTWYRVWSPNAAKIGYCHSSVVTRV